MEGAIYTAKLILTPARTPDERPGVFFDITHYLNADFEEVGYTTSIGPHPSYFNPPRKWHPDMLAKYEVLKIP